MALRTCFHQSFEVLLYYPQLFTYLSTSILLRCMTICSHMKCPFCNASTKVYNSRSSHQSTQKWRRRQCLDCNKSFTTREKVDYTGIVSVRSTDNKVSPYSREKLLLSIVRASTNLDLPPEALTELTDSIELTLKQIAFFTRATQDSNTIIESAIIVLKRYNKNLAVQYLNQVYRNNPPLATLKQLLED